MSGRTLPRGMGVAIVVMVALLVFLRAASFPFMGDDRDIIVENTAVTEPSPWFESIVVPYWNIPHGEDMALWRPATTGVFSLTWALGDGSPVGFHVLNLVLHALNSGLIVLLVTGLAGWGMGFLAGILFAVHPVHAEAVANVVGLAELLSASAFLWACLVYWRSKGRPALPSAFAIGALYAVTILAKESGATLPAALFLLHQFRVDTTRATWRDDLARHRALGLVMAGVLLAVAWGRARVLGGLHPPLPPVGADLLVEAPRIWTVAAIWVDYFKLLVFPFGLSLDYSPGRIPVRLMWDATSMLGVGLGVGVLVLAALSWRRGRSARAFGLGIVWFVLTVLPTSNLPVLTGVLLAERTLYLPSLGIVLAGAALLHAARRPLGRAFHVLCLAVIVGFGVQSWDRTRSWASDDIYWAEVATRSPENGRGHQHTARRLWLLGERGPALEAYSQAFGRLGGDHIIAAELAERLFEARRFKASEVVARIAWEKGPNYASGPAVLALALLGQGRDEEALAAARAAVAAEPQGAQARDLLRGIEQAVAGRRAEPPPVPRARNP